ncbi:hypothetical protein M1446_02230 [Candidatus Dependentiae bacterium]|nr:hypothetical protein [Candidatus Dependentiae bacterium]
MKKILKLLVIFCVITSSIEIINSESIASIIDHPGTFGLGISFQANPTDPNDAIVRITSNDVLLDLSSYKYSQASGNTVGGFDGIFISPGLKNVHIMNGIIGPVTGRGIYIGDGCSQILLENIVIQQSATTGILLDGNLTGTGISTFKIKNCAILTCTGSSGNPAYGMRIINGSNFRLEMCVCNFNDAGISTSGFGFSLENCSNGNILDSTAASNGGFSYGIGFTLNQCSICAFTNCASLNNIARDISLTSSAIGFLMNQCNGIGFINCKAVANRNVSANGIGFQSQNGTAFINGCFGQGNIGKTAAGFILTGTENGTTIENCQASGNIAIGASGKSFGILLDGSRNCIIDNNNCNRNTGIEGYGLRDTTTNTTNLIYGNVTFLNTTTGFDVTRTVGTFPVLYANVGDFSAIQNASEYMNVAIG